MWQFLQMFFDRRVRLAFTVPEFAQANKNLIIIVADPETDEIYVTHRGAMVRGRIRSAKKGGKMLKGLLKESQFNDSSDGLIVGLIDALQVRLTLPAMNEFAKMIDGALFNISKSLRKPAKKSGTGNQLPNLPDGSQPSPISMSQLEAGRTQVK